MIHLYRYTFYGTYVYVTSAINICLLFLTILLKVFINACAHLRTCSYHQFSHPPPSFNQIRVKSQNTKRNYTYGMWSLTFWAKTLISRSRTWVRFIFLINFTFLFDEGYSLETLNFAFRISTVYQPFLFWFVFHNVSAAYAAKRLLHFLGVSKLIDFFVLFLVK